MTCSEFHVLLSQDDASDSPGKTPFNEGRFLCTKLSLWLQKA